MHDACEEWVRSSAARYVSSPAKVIELGGRNVNGSNRVHFDPTRVAYVCIDKLPGSEVDLVADACDWRPDEADADAVICTNVLEHEPRWRLLLATAFACLKPDGLLIVTTVTDPFPPHSGIDGEALRPGEHYEGVSLGDLQGALTDAGFFIATTRETREGDVQAVARKPWEL